MRRFEFTEGSSSKFWEISLEGKAFTVRYGKIGTDGQSSSKSFPDADKARIEHDKLIAEKTKKGYGEVSSGGKSAAPAAATAAAKKAPTASAGVSKTFKIFADYHHFYLSDATCTEALGDAWTPDAVTERLAIGDGVIGIGTARNMDVPVEVHVLAAAPPDDAASFQHVTECSLPVPTGALIVNGPTDSNDDARRFAVPPGSVRVRASHLGLDTLSEDGLRGKDRYRLEIWPAPASAPRVVKQWVEPVRVKAAPTEIKPPKTFKQAVAAARAGRIDLALPKLVELSEKGQGLSAVAAAEIFAFRGDWPRFIEHAGRFTRDLTVIGACNVFDQMLELLRRAGRETGDWKAVENAATGVPKEAVPGFHERSTDFVAEIKAKKYVGEKAGRAPRNPSAADKVAYEKAVAEAPSGKRFQSDPRALHRHLFSLAASFGFEDDALRLFDAHRDELTFDDAMGVARMMVRRKREADAWAALEATIPSWGGGWVCTIGPAEVLIDPLLAPLFTPERGEKLLSTPRWVG